MIRQGLRYLLQLVLYTHLWVAAGALALSLQTQYLLTGQWYLSPYAAFVGAGTLFVYSLHRLVFIRRWAQSSSAPERVHTLYPFRWPLRVSCVLSSLLAAYLYSRFPTHLQLQLLLPCFISLGYVIPVWQGKRLRDFPYAKLFLLVAAWTWLTALMPLYGLPTAPLAAVIGLCLERACFILALGLAFDIRDIQLDRRTGLATLPAYLGARAARRLAFGALALMAALAIGQAVLGFYTPASALAIGCTAAATAYLIHRARAPRSDDYYLGLLDGMLLAQALLVGLFNG